jgi:filamentous hemagglutinin
MIMNTQIYRIVFNQLRGAWMAVAEHVCAAGKLKRPRTEKCARLVQAADQLHIDSSRDFNWLALAFGSMLFTMPVQADIVADPLAPAQQQPFIINAANGVPLVNIQTPDSKGLSHNTYQQFDVMQNGVILNNSCNYVQTQLGGWVQGNPNMAAGAASTILNEVNSSRPSLLNGFIEVAGSRAQVIVANPSGITCNGCGFINAWRATLVTGSPVFTGGDLSAYRVTGGVIKFLGTGLDTRAMDYTDIISRAVVANSGVWAKKLNVVLGNQQVNVASNGDVGALTPLAASNEPKPQVALDVAALGGMYAGKIHLIGTELGLGVNNQGAISATSEGLSLDINGQLTNQGSVVSQGYMALKSTGLKNTGDILSGGAMGIDTGDIDNQHKITATSLTVKARDISNTNAVLGATQDLRIQANQLSGKGKVLAGGNITVNLQQDYVQNTGLMQADGNLSLSSKGAIFNQTNILAGKKLAIKANALSNESVIKGEDTELDIAKTLTNTGLIDGDDTLIKADVLTNKGRARIFGDHLAIQAGKLNNLAETVNGTPRAATIAARDRLDLGVSEALVNQAKSQIFSLGGLRIGRSLDAQHGAIGQGDSLVNSNATIEAYGDMHINMAAIQNLNAGLKTETVVTNTENYDQFTPKDQSSLYDTQDYPIWQIGNEGISWRYGSNYNLPFNFREYWRYIYSGTTHETRVKTSLPGEIIAGQHLNITGNVINSDSRIIAGGKLAHSGGTLNNKNTTGNTTTSYSGTSYYYDYDGGGKGFSYDVSINPYNPAPSVTTQPLATTQYLAQTTSSKNGTVASLSPNSLGSQRPDESLLNTLTSLYRQTAPGAGYLIETDPRFANYQQWLSSDYMLKALSYDPAYQTKRLGDGFYEQRLVREQINQLTGRRFLAGYSSDLAQYQALMNNGITFANAHQLVPGVALSDTQVAQLTSDIVWLVTQTVKLPDGSTTQALVPQVYTRLKAGDLTGAGSLIAGQTLNINLNASLNNNAQPNAGTLFNSGTLAGQQVLAIQADHIQNLSGNMVGEKVNLNARQDILNQGGKITAQQALTLNAGKDIRIKSTTVNSNNSAQTGKQKGQLGYSERTSIDRVAGLYVTDSANAVLVAMAGGNIQLDAAKISNLSQNGVAILSAGDSIDLTTQQTSLSTSTGAAKNYIKRSTTEELGTQINTADEIQLQAGNALSMRAANITSEQGKITAQANEVNITAGEATLDSEQYRKTKKSGFMSSSKTERRNTFNETSALGSNISGETVAIQGTNNIGIQGSNVVSTNGTTVQAGGDIAITSATNTQHETHSKQVKKSGFGASGSSIGYNKSKLNQNTESTSTTQTASTIGSVEGNVRIEAGKTYTQTASDVIAPKGDIDITAQKVDIASADETNQRTEEMRYKQTGISVGISNPVISAIQTTDQMRKAGSKTDDPRMQALAAATTALSIKNAAEAVKAGRGGNLADQAGGISLNFSIGTSKSKSSSQNQQTIAKASHINTGQNLNVTATGAGTKSDLTVIGSQIQAGQDLSLRAQDQLNLLAAKNTQSLQSSNKSSSASIGISVGLGTGGVITPNASFNSSRGKANGQDTSWTETIVQGSNKVSLSSGTDTNLKGSQVIGKQVIANVGTSGQGNLNIESLQDTSTYQSKQNSSGASVSFGANGIPSGGSVSSGKQKINSDYASVNEQAGIYAGEGGFQLNVNGNTSLKGAVIASTEKAIQDNKNSLTTQTLTTSNIENKAEYDAKGISINAGVGVTEQPNGGGFKSSPTASAGNSHLSDESSSVTVSGISGGTVTITDSVKQQATGQDNATTLATLNRDVKVNAEGQAVDSQGNPTAGTLKPVFDQQQVSKELNAQLQITQAFSQQAQQFKIELRKKVDIAKAEQDAIADALKNSNLTDDQRSLLIAKGIDAQSNIDQLEKASLLFSAISGGLTAPTNNVGGIVAATLAPQVANQIGQYFKDHGTQGSASHILAHGVLAAAVAEFGSNNPLGAALSAMSGEAIAPLISDLLYGKSANELNAEQKATITVIASLGGVAVGYAIDSNSNSVTQAYQSTQNAVDNNWGMVGHYSTMATVLYLAGFSSKDAKAIALAAWGPDTDRRNAMSTNSVVGAGSSTSNQQIIHLLNGKKDPKEVIAQQEKLALQVGDILLTIKKYESDPLKKAAYLTTPSVQNTLHAFGDAFAHVDKDGISFSVVIGHLVYGTSPDNPQRHPDAYKNYVNTLFNIASNASVSPRVNNDIIANLIAKVTMSSEKDQAGVLKNTLGTMIKAAPTETMVSSPVADCGYAGSCFSKPVGSQVNPQINKIYGATK